MILNKEFKCDKGLNGKSSIISFNCGLSIPQKLAHFSLVFFIVKTYNNIKIKTPIQHIDN